MTNKKRLFYQTKRTSQNKLSRGILFSLIIVLGIYSNAAHGASVVSRETTASRPTVARTNNVASRTPVTTESAQETEPVTESAGKPDNSEEVIYQDTNIEELQIEDKSSQFESILDSSVSSGSLSNSDNQLAEMIRQQRAALDAADAVSAATAKTQAAISAGQNACDTELRKCMQEKCGNDFSNCANNSDTLWGDKMESCRIRSNCTTEEFTAFSAEIKADRDINAELAAYTAVINCGNRYNNCIVTQCGQNFNNCLGKSAGDAAISKCDSIAQECKQQDSGLASRAMEVFATLRQDAEKQIQKDEERLYELRDLMRNQCAMLGAMFDERTLDCVYTVNFYAGNSSSPYASKKAYAGSDFDCNPNWFGIDVTTFMENAYRLTRSETSATSSVLGSGLGLGIGAITSGAISRAIETQKAEKALEEAEASRAQELPQPTAEASEDASNNEAAPTETASSDGNATETTSEEPDMAALKEQLDSEVMDSTINDVNNSIKENSDLSTNISDTSSAQESSDKIQKIQTTNNIKAPATTSQASRDTISRDKLTSATNTSKKTELEEAIQKTNEMIEKEQATAKKALSNTTTKQNITWDEYINTPLSNPEAIFCNPYGMITCQKGYTRKQCLSHYPSCLNNDLKQLYELMYN